MYYHAPASPQPCPPATPHGHVLQPRARCGGTSSRTVHVPPTRTIHIPPTWTVHLPPHGPFTFLPRGPFIYPHPHGCRAWRPGSGCVWMSCRVRPTTRRRGRSGCRTRSLSCAGPGAAGDVHAWHAYCLGVQSVEEATSDGSDDMWYLLHVVMIRKVV